MDHSPIGLIATRKYLEEPKSCRIIFDGIQNALTGPTRGWAPFDQTADENSSTSQPLGRIFSMAKRQPLLSDKLQSFSRALGLLAFLHRPVSVRLGLPSIRLCGRLS